MQRPGYAFKTHLARGGKRALRSYGTEPFFDGQGLQHQSGAIGFAKAINALRRVMLVYPRDPAMDIVRFLHAIGGQFPAALAMAPGIWQQDRIAMLQQQVSV